MRDMRWKAGTRGHHSHFIGHEWHEAHDGSGDTGQPPLQVRRDNFDLSHLVISTDHTAAANADGSIQPNNAPKLHNR